MDAGLFSTLQGQQVAAAHAVGTSLLPKSGARSTVVGATRLPGAPAANAAVPLDAGSTGSTSGSSGTSSSSTGADATASGATITSSDFLTLLVSELKNQDPTQPTDPNEYISQLVGVNSLEQLIQINSGIAALGAPATSTGSSGGTGSSGAGSGGAAGSLTPATPGSLAGVPVQHSRGAERPGLA